MHPSPARKHPYTGTCWSLCPERFIHVVTLESFLSVPVSAHSLLPAPCFLRLSFPCQPHRFSSRRLTSGISRKSCRWSCTNQPTGRPHSGLCSDPKRKTLSSMFPSACAGKGKPPCKPLRLLLCGPSFQERKHLTSGSNGSTSRSLQSALSVRGDQMGTCCGLAAEILRRRALPERELPLVCPLSGGCNSGCWHAWAVASPGGGSRPEGSVQGTETQRKGRMLRAEGCVSERGRKRSCLKEDLGGELGRVEAQTAGPGSPRPCGAGGLLSKPSTLSPTSRPRCQCRLLGKIPCAAPTPQRPSPPTSHANLYPPLSLKYTSRRVSVLCHRSTVPAAPGRAAARWWLRTTGQHCRKERPCRPLTLRAPRRCCSHLQCRVLDEGPQVPCLCPLCHVHLPSSLRPRGASHWTLLTIEFHNFALTMVQIPGKIETSGSLAYSFLSGQTGSLVNPITFSQLGHPGVKSTKEKAVCWASG